MYFNVRKGTNHNQFSGAAPASKERLRVLHLSGVLCCERMASFCNEVGKVLIKGSRKHEAPTHSVSDTTQSETDLKTSH